MKGGQSSGSGGQSGMPSWLGMAQNYFGGGQGGGYGAPPWWGGSQGGGMMQPGAYAQGGALSGADPYGGSGGAYPTYTGPPRDQPLGAPAVAPVDAGGTGSVITPGASATMQPGLLGASNTGAPQNFAGLFQGWHNRGYGIPGVSTPGVQPTTQPPISPPQGGQQSPYGLPYGLFGGYM